MTDTMSRTTRWLTVEEAAQAIGCSVRTIQRRIRAGELQASCRTDGRTIVEVDDTATAVGQAGEVAVVVRQLQEQAQATERLSTALTIIAGRDADLMQRRVVEVEARARRSGWLAIAGWGAAAILLAAGLSASVAAWSGEAATRRHLTDTADRLKVAEATLREQGERLAAATAERQMSDERVARLQAERDDLADRVSREAALGPVF